jgi:hypothetical protein
MRKAKPAATIGFRAPMRCALLAAGLLALAGCDLTGQNTNNSNTANNTNPAPVARQPADDDPLHGPIRPVGMAPATSPTQPGPPTPNDRVMATGGVPALPPPGSASSTSVLVAGNAQGNLLSDGRDLRIPNGSSAPAAAVPDPWGHSPRTTNGPGAELVPVGGPGNADGFQVLQAHLQQRNVIRQKLELLGENQWKFTCTVQSPVNPNLGAIVDATASDPLEAISSAISKIDEQQAQLRAPAGTSHP